MLVSLRLPRIVSRLLNNLDEMSKSRRGLCIYFAKCVATLCIAFVVELSIGKGTKSDKVSALHTAINTREFYLQLAGLGPTSSEGVDGPAARWARNRSWAASFLTVGTDWDTNASQVRAALALNWSITLTVHTSPRYRQRTPKAHVRDANFSRAVESITQGGIQPDQVLLQYICEDDSAGSGFSRDLLHMARSAGYTNGATRLQPAEAQFAWRDYLQEAYNVSRSYWPLAQTRARVGYPHSTHAAARLADVVMIELLNDDVGTLAPSLAHLRGAGHQFNATWGVDFSLWWGAINGCVQNLPASLHRRAMAIAYVAGANVVAVEDCGWIDKVTGQPNAVAREVDKFGSVVEVMRRRGRAAATVVGTGGENNVKNAKKKKKKPERDFSLESEQLQAPFSRGDDTLASAVDMTAGGGGGGGGGASTLSRVQPTIIPASVHQQFLKSPGNYRLPDATAFGAALIISPSLGWSERPSWAAAAPTLWDFANIPASSSRGATAVDLLIGTAYPGSSAGQFGYMAWPFGAFENELNPPASPFARSSITPEYAASPEDVFQASANLPFGRFRDRNQLKEWFEDGHNKDKYRATYYGGEDGNRAAGTAGNIDMGPKGDDDGGGEGAGGGGGRDPADARPMTDTRWGDMIDVLVADEENIAWAQALLQKKSDQGCDASTSNPKEVLNRVQAAAGLLGYRVAIWANGSTSPAARQTLMKYAQRGGTVVVAAGNIGPEDAPLTGVVPTGQVRAVRAWKWTLSEKGGGGEGGGGKGGGGEGGGLGGGESDRGQTAPQVGHFLTAIVETNGSYTSGTSPSSSSKLLLPPNLEVVAATAPGGLPLVVRRGLGSGWVYTCLTPFYSQGTTLPPPILRLFDHLMEPLQTVNVVEGLPALYWTSSVVASTGTTGATSGSNNNNTNTPAGKVAASFARLAAISNNADDGPWRGRIRITLPTTTTPATAAAASSSSSSSSKVATCTKAICENVWTGTAIPCKLGSTTTIPGLSNAATAPTALLDLTIGAHDVALVTAECAAQ